MQLNDGAADFRDSEYEMDEGLLNSRSDSREQDRPARPIIFGTSTIKPRSTEVLKVSTRSRPSAVAGAIAGVIRDSGHVEVQSIGAGATNQAIKAVAIARSYLSEEGIDIVCIPSFIDVAIDAEERTAIRLLIQHRGA